MPNIPIYESKVSPKPLQTAPVQMDNYTSGGRMMSEVGQQLDQIASKFNELDILRKKTKSSVNLHTELEEISFQADNDPDLDSLPKYQQKIDDAIGKHLQTIPQGLARQQASEEFRLKGYSTFSGVRQGFRRRQIAEQKDALKFTLDQGEVAYINSSNPEEKALHIQSAIKAIDDSVLVGAITSNAGNMAKKNLKQSWDLSEAKYDSLTNPELFLEKGNEYYQIPNDEFIKQKNTAIRTMSLNKQKNNVLIKEVQRKNDINKLLKLSEKRIFELSKEEVADRISETNRQIASGEISQEIGFAEIRVLQSPKSIDKEKKVVNSGFTTHAIDIFKSENNEEKSKAISRLLDSVSKGQLGDEQMSVILKVAFEAGEDLSEPKKNVIQKVLGFFSDLGNKDLRKDDEKVSEDRMSADFMKAVSEGKDIEQAKEMALFNEQVRTNPNRVKYKLDEVVNINGFSYKVIGFFDSGDPKLQQQ